MNKILLGLLQSVLASALVAGCATAETNNPENLSDVEIAHVAYTADNIDIRYAHLALAISTNPDIHDFARSMIRDHTAVNDRALALLKKLKVSPMDNYLSKQLIQRSHQLINEMRQLKGAEFDKRYANNELSYHKAVNDLVENSFIPNIENAEVKELFKTGLGIFKGHQAHAEIMVSSLRK
ncbi:MAG: DUF4142 domain-containing protein [Ectothiorhodospiraceae bacterium]|nr:DUF4142 domain-containing protein [Ectothiorhodospiraceae bacterium]